MCGVSVGLLSRLLEDGLSTQQRDAHQPAWGLLAACDGHACGQRRPCKPRACWELGCVMSREAAVTGQPPTRTAPLLPTALPSWTQFLRELTHTLGSRLPTGQGDPEGAASPGPTGDWFRLESSTLLSGLGSFLSPKQHVFRF